MTVTPFSRVAAPSAAVACTTSLAFTAPAGGVTVNEAVTARDGAPSRNTVGPSAAALHPCGNCNVQPNAPECLISARSTLAALGTLMPRTRN